MNDFLLPNALKLSHLLMEQCIQAGDTVVDATAGNGRDTLELARLVGAQGTVYAFDVQELAIARTREKLIEADLLCRVRLVHGSHEFLRDAVAVPIRFATFNLGFLPGGDKTVTTKTESTLVAVSAAIDLLLPGGICTVCVYAGHEEGDTELRALHQMLSPMQKDLAIMHFAFVNQPKRPPELFAIQKQLEI